MRVSSECVLSVSRVNLLPPFLDGHCCKHPVTKRFLWLLADYRGDSVVKGEWNAWQTSSCACVFECMCICLAARLPERQHGFDHVMLPDRGWRESETKWDLLSGKVELVILGFAFFRLFERFKGKKLHFFIYYFMFKSICIKFNYQKTQNASFLIPRKFAFLSLKATFSWFLSSLHLSSPLSFTVHPPISHSCLFFYPSNSFPVSLS